MSDNGTGRAVQAEEHLILIVDDEFDLLATYAMLFQYHGFRVRTASNGREALELAAQERPHIVISDFMMPVMGGAELCRAWRADPDLREIPFILCSAGILRQDLDVPFDAFFKKPLSLDVLLAEIRRLIGQRNES